MGQSSRIHVDGLTETEARMIFETIVGALEEGAIPSHRRRTLETIRNKFENVLRAFTAGKLDRQREDHDARVKREGRELFSEGRLDARSDDGTERDSRVPRGSAD